MKISSIIVIIGTLAVSTMALPVSTQSGGESLDIKPQQVDAVKSELKPATNMASTTTTTRESDAEEMVGSAIDPSMESDFTPFYITSPSTAATYNPNDVVTTSWYNGIEGPFIINVIQGPDPLDMQSTGIFLHADGQSGSYQWHIPENIPAGLYSFKYMYKFKGAISESYSEPFRIVKPEMTQRPVAMNMSKQSPEIVEAQKPISMEAKDQESSEATEAEKPDDEESSENPDAQNPDDEESSEAAESQKPDDEETSESAESTDSNNQQKNDED